MKKLKILLLLFLHVSCTSETDNTNCMDCGEGLLDGYLYKEVTLTDIPKLSEIEISAINGPAFKKVNNFEESFQDIIPGDILNINLFGNIFQEEIKSVEKSSKNKIVTTYSQAEENESFVVIGEELAFGKFHINEKVFLLKRDSKMTYIVNTAEAGLVIPQFSEEDYSTRQE